MTWRFCCFKLMGIGLGGNVPLAVAHVRWGHAEGRLVMGGQRVVVNKPLPSWGVVSIVLLTAAKVPTSRSLAK